MDEKTLSTDVATPHIYAYGVSPSGQVLAVLVRSGDDLAYATNWVVIVDAKTGQVRHKLQRTEPAAYWALAAYYPTQIMFSSDGRFLVIQERGHVDVLDVATLRTTRSITAEGQLVPISICGSATNDVFAISFATGHAPQSQGQRIDVRVEMTDVSNGVQLGSWASDDIPQALSPDGKLAAVSDHEASKSLLKLDVIDTASGKKVTALDAGFKFPRQEGDPIVGRVVGRFLSSTRMVLTPDDSFDRSGHHSGTDIRIVDILDSAVVQRLQPDHFGPTGEIGVSRDGRIIIVASRYVNPSFYTHPHDPPSASPLPNLIALFGKGKFHITGVITSVHSGLEGGGLKTMFRLASSGSIIAVAEDHGITVFQRPE